MLAEIIQTEQFATRGLYLSQKPNFELIQHFFQLLQYCWNSPFCVLVFLSVVWYISLAFHRYFREILDPIFFWDPGGSPAWYYWADDEAKRRSKRWKMTVWIRFEFLWFQRKARSMKNSIVGKLFYSSNHFFTHRNIFYLFHLAWGYLALWERLILAPCEVLNLFWEGSYSCLRERTLFRETLSRIKSLKISEHFWLFYEMLTPNKNIIAIIQTSN